MTARTMEHEEAVQNLVAERYLLGELTENDRDAYEEHMFSCPVCFEQIKAGTEFVGGLRRMGAEKPVAEQAPAMPGFFAALRQPLTALAFAVLTIVSGISLHQYRVISDFKQTQVMPAFFLSDGARAAAVQLTVPANSQFVLKIQLLEPGDFKSYEGRLLTEFGNAGDPFPISAELAQAKETLQIRLHSGSLRPGTYSLVVEGISPDGHKTELTKYNFQLQLQE